jgi:hypothetical protein
MSAIEVRVMTAPETAAYLRQQLGPIVAWEDWLRDRRRGKGHQLADVDLQPCASMKGLCRRPLYAVVDTARFVLAVRRRHPGAAPGIKPEVMVIEVDAEDCRSWRMKPPAPMLHKPT